MSISKGLQRYKSKWLPADLVFVADAIGNGGMQDQYHLLLTSFGFSPSTVNVIISFLEVIRIGFLVYQRH